MVSIQTNKIAETSNMVWSSISCNLIVLRVDWCIDLPQMLIRAKGKYIVVIFCHSSALRTPAVASCHILEIWLSPTPKTSRLLRFDYKSKRQTL